MPNPSRSLRSPVAVLALTAAFCAGQASADSWVCRFDRICNPGCTSVNVSAQLVTERGQARLVLADQPTPLVGRINPGAQGRQMLSLSPDNDRIATTLGNLGPDGRIEIAHTPQGGNRGPIYYFGQCTAVR